MIIDGGVITGNSCNQRGGGIFNRGLMDMHGGTISSNYSGWNGGGIYSKQDLTIYDGIISENTCEGDGSAIYNESEMTMYGGTISNNSGYCFTNIGTVTMNDGFITGNEGDYIIYNTGVFNMTGGIISNNKSSSHIIKIMHYGEFNLSGGYIIDNEAQEIVYVYDGDFNMTGGVISGNTVSSVITIEYGTSEFSFSMSAGEITGNSGSVISTTVPIALSGNALISGDEGVPDIILDDYDSYINVSGLLNNIEELTIDLDSYKEGIKILAGSPLTENVISKFRIYDTNYGIDNNGYTKYIGEGNVYYIHKDGDDNAIGTTSEQPLRTIEGALEK